MRNLLFVFSNRKGKVKKKIIHALDSFRRKNLDYSVDYLITEHPSHLSEAIHAFAEKYDQGIVFVAGGDGSLNEATNALATIDSQIALCPIPFGTANDFCRLLYKNFDINEFLQDLPNAKFAWIDILKLSGNIRILGTGPDNINIKNKPIIDSTYLLNVASLGLDTEILRSAYIYMKNIPILKGSAYLLAVIKHFKKFDSIPLTLTIDGKKNKEECLLAAFCNGGFYGNGFNPAPNCDLQDGKMNYCYVPPIKKSEFLKLAPKYKNGSILSAPKVKTGFAKSISIKSSNQEPILANYDGILFDSIDFKINVIDRAILLAFVGEFAQDMITDQSSLLKF